MGQATVAVSLVAAVAGILANEAVASIPSAEPPAATQLLSARVAKVADKVRLFDRTSGRDLIPEQQIAQWRNK